MSKAIPLPGLRTHRCWRGKQQKDNAGSSPTEPVTSIAREKCSRLESNQQPSASEAESTELQAGTCQELGQAVSPLVPMLVPDDRKTVENGLDTTPKPVEADFAAALKMIAMLPLSDTERAEAVRRLLSSNKSS